MSHVSKHAILASNGQRATMKIPFPDCSTGLRMYLHPSGKRTQVSLEGDLAGGWAQELERCWRALSGPGDALYIDVSRLESADPNGYKLLRKMRIEGVTLTGFDADSGSLRSRLSRLWNIATRGHGFHVLTISRLR